MFQVDERKPTINRLCMENFKREMFHWEKYAVLLCSEEPPIAKKVIIVIISQ